MTNITLTFRKANDSDRPFLLELRKASMSEHLAKAGIVLDDTQHMTRINEFYQESYLILKGEQRIGLIKFGVIVDRLHIRQFQIMPQFHSKGIGGQVLNILKRKAKEKGLPITLNVLLKNPAFALYQRHGFVVEGQNELEYQMRWRAN